MSRQRRYTQDWQTGELRKIVNNVNRRRSWFTGASPRQFGNLALAGLQYAMKAERMLAWPALIKLDISPLCNLRCTYCVHATPGEGSHPALSEQEFRKSQMISVDAVDAIMSQVAGRSIAAALYYLGDPLMHPDLDQICGITAGHGLRCHISTNYSFKLSDARIASLVRSGLTHLTVCVDGLRQDSYGKTRVGGQIERVLDNLERTLRARDESGVNNLHVEVQYIHFQHNTDQLAEAAAWCATRGVDQFTDYWGNLHNYTDETPGNYRVRAPKPSRPLPQCLWPHFAMQLKYDGSAIPCCYYRHADQYRRGADDRSVGNVLETSVWDVWNSTDYRALRRLVSDPSRALTEPALGATFCEGCPTVYETDLEPLTADRHRWEDLYDHDARGVRRRARQSA